MMNTTATRAVVGGAVLRSRTDVGLAVQWAEYVHGNVWERLSHGQRCEATAEALAELRGTLSVTDEED
jgi:hypothetical protein